MNNIVSVAEGELAGHFHIEQEVVISRTILEELDHSWSSIPIKTDNSIVVGIICKTICPRKSRSMDMILG